MKTNKKIYLTKGRLGALHTALSLDDVLYEKYRRLYERVLETERRLEKKGNVWRVIQVKGDANYILQIDEILSTPDGQVVYVR